MTSISLLMTTVKDNGKETITETLLFLPPIKKETEDEMTQSGREKRPY